MTRDPLTRLTTDAATAGRRIIATDANDLAALLGVEAAFMCRAGGYARLALHIDDELRDYASEGHRDVNASELTRLFDRTADGIVEVSS